MAFVAPATLQSVVGIDCRPERSVCERRFRMCTTDQQISRRDFGKLAVGACAAGLAAAVAANVPAASAQSSKKSKPVFTKDESGIQFYDVKEGNGAAPADGDFVVIDYVG